MSGLTSDFLMPNEKLAMSNDCVCAPVIAHFSLLILLCHHSQQLLLHRQRQFPMFLRHHMNPIHLRRLHNLLRIHHFHTEPLTQTLHQRREFPRFLPLAVQRVPFRHIFANFNRRQYQNPRLVIPEQRHARGVQLVERLNRANQRADAVDARLCGVLLQVVRAEHDDDGVQRAQGVQRVRQRAQAGHEVLAGFRKDGGSAILPVLVDAPVCAKFVLQNACPAGVFVVALAGAGDEAPSVAVTEAKNVFHANFLPFAKRAASRVKNEMPLPIKFR